MNPSTITASKFYLFQGTTPVEGAVEYNGVTASFIPVSSLIPNTPYEATISSGVLDITGANLEKDYVWSFTTGATPDIIIPAVTLLDPLNSATSVALNKLIAVTFSETIDQSTINSTTFNLKKGSVLVAGAITYSEQKPLLLLQLIFRRLPYIPVQLQPE